MNCPNCGVKLASISRFCPECGAKIISQEEKKNKKEPDSIEELLVTIVQNYGGAELYKETNARKLAGLLKDFAGSNFQDEVKLLSRVVPEGFQEILYNANNSSPEEKQGALAAFKMKLKENLFMLEEKATEATNILAAGLGWEIKLEGQSNQTVQKDSHLETQTVTTNTVDVDSYEDDYLKNLSIRELLDLEGKKHNVQVQYYIGLYYEVGTHYGKDETKDDKKAFEWYQKAADQGYAGAKDHLGEMYNEGCGVPKDEQKAVEWFQKAAEQGDTSAKFNLELIEFIRSIKK